MSEILKRCLSLNEARNLVKAIKLTPNIMGYSINEWKKSKSVFVAQNKGGMIQGACLCSKMSDELMNIAALYIYEEFRNQGLGKLLFIASLNHALSENKSVYTTSANPIIIKMMYENKFQVYNDIISLANSNKSFTFKFIYYYSKWILNTFRCIEIIRKSIFLNPKEKFVYGLLLNK